MDGAVMVFHKQIQGSHQLATTVISSRSPVRYNLDLAIDEHTNDERRLKKHGIATSSIRSFFEVYLA